MIVILALVCIDIIGTDYILIKIINVCGLNLKYQNHHG